MAYEILVALEVTRNHALGREPFCSGLPALFRIEKLHGLQRRRHLTLAADNEVRAYVSALVDYARTSPSTRVFVFDGLPTGFHSWGTEGILLFLFGHPNPALYSIDDKEAARIIRSLEHASDKYRGSLDHALDRSSWDGTHREDDINSFVKDFYAETKKLRNQFDHHKSTSADVQSVLDRAARIDQFMKRRPLTSRAQNDWAAVNAHLDELARAYGVTRLF